MAAFSRIEIIKGPASASVGRSSSAGLVNYVRKLPRDDQFATTIIQFGKYNHFRGHLDTGGPLTRDGAFTYRLNMTYQDTDTWGPGTMPDGSGYRFSWHLPQYPCAGTGHVALVEPARSTADCR